MSELKTKPHDGDVNAFLDAVEDPQRKTDSFALLDLFKKTTGEPPVMWGDSIVGFGSYHYKTRSGREGDWMLTGFSPRKQDLTIYIMAGFDRYADLMTRLGKFKTGKSCLYAKRLEDLHLPTLKKLVRESARWVKEHGGGC